MAAAGVGDGESESRDPPSPCFGDLTGSTDAAPSQARLWPFEPRPSPLQGRHGESTASRAPGIARCRTHTIRPCLNAIAPENQAPPVAPRAMSRPGDRSRATGVDAPHLPCEVDVSRDAAAIRPDRGSYGGRTRDARRRRRWIHSSSLVQPGPARGARRRSGRDDLSFGGRSGRLRAPALGDAPRGRSTLEPPLDVVGFTPSTTRPRRRRETPDRLAFL